MNDEIKKTGLEIAKEKREQMKAEGIKVVFKNPIEKALENPKSLRLAINAKCFDCVGRDYDPNYRARIRDCTAVDVCSLHPLRPFRDDSPCE